LRRYPRRQCPHLFRPGLPNGTNEKKHEALDEDLIDQFGAMADASGGKCRVPNCAGGTGSEVERRAGGRINEGALHGLQQQRGFRIMYPMRRFVALPVLLFFIHSVAAADVTQLWSDLSAKRKALTGYHQEFDRTTSYTVVDHVQSGKQSTVLDGAGARWREETISGAGDWSYIFDGSALFHLESREYTSKKLAHEKEAPEPQPYGQGGVSVDEDRSTVQKCLKEHPHEYPIALTTENEMPRAYQIGVFPTYVIIDADGTSRTQLRATADFRN